MTQGIDVYDIGDTVRASARFTSPSLVLADPDTITLEISVPGGAVLTFVFDTDDELVRDATGIYHLDLIVDVGGDYFARWTATGLVQAVESWQFLVKKDLFAAG